MNIANYNTPSTGQLHMTEMTGQLDPRFMRSFRSTWKDTPSSHTVPYSTLLALGLTRGDFLDIKAWIFLVARKLHFENGERAAFKVSMHV